MWKLVFKRFTHLVIQHIIRDWTSNMVTYVQGVGIILLLSF